MDRSQLRYLLNSGPSRVFDVRKLKLEQNLAPIFKIGKLNGAVLLKQTNPEGAALNEEMPPIPTVIFMPYDRKRPEEGGESFTYSPSGMRTTVFELIGECSIKQEDLNHDIALLSTLDRTPSFSPYLIKDALERANIKIPDGYFTLPEREAAMIKQRMRARLRPLVASAFGGANKSVSETSIERLVQTLWELKDMTELQPLVTAFKIPSEHAPEIFYSWLGIAFFENEYLKLQLRLKRMAAWMSTRTAPRELLPRGLLDHYNHTVTSVRKHLQAHWKCSLAILQDYTSTYEALVDASGNAAPFIEFLRHSKDHFWTLGGRLGCLEQSVEIWEQICSRVNYAALTLERANELFGMLNLINASAGEKASALTPPPPAAREAATM